MHYNCNKSETTLQIVYRNILQMASAMATNCSFHTNTSNLHVFARSRSDAPLVAE